MVDPRDVERWLSSNGIACVRLEATNHDGLILGKYLSPAKFAGTLEKGSLFADTCFGVDPAGEVAVGWDWGPWRGQVADIKMVADPSTLDRAARARRLGVGALRLHRSRRRPAAGLLPRAAEADDRSPGGPRLRGLGGTRDRVHGLRGADPAGPRAGLPRPDAARGQHADHLPDVRIAGPRAVHGRRAAAARRARDRVGLLEQRDRAGPGRDQPGAEPAGRVRGQLHPHQAGTARRRRRAGPQRHLHGLGDRSPPRRRHAREPLPESRRVRTPSTATARAARAPSCCGAGSPGWWRRCRPRCPS